MAEKKKQKPAAFAQEKKTFTGEIPKKANEGKGKKSAAYQPRDADTTSGHDVQRSKNTKKYQKADASGQNVQKSEGAEAGEKSKSDFMQPDSTFTEEAGEEQGRKIASDDYRHRDTYHSSQKKGRYQRREIKSRERVKQFDFEQDFQTKDTTFTEEAEPEFHGSKKLDRLQKKNYGILGVHQFQTFEMEFSHLQGFTQSQIVDIDYQTFGDIGIDGFYFQFSHRQTQFTTGTYTLRVSFELNRNFHNNGFLIGYFQEIHMQNSIGYRVELQIFQYRHLFFTIDSQLDCKNIGSIPTVG